MIRYNKTIEVATNRNGDISLRTDIGQTFKTTVVKEYNQFTIWLQAHHTLLREYQRDFLQIIHQAYSPQTGLHPIELYWVYPQGRGYLEQSSDIAFAKIPSKNIWILMTNQHTWMEETQYGNFFLNVDDAIGAVTNKETKDAIWAWRDAQLGIRAPKKQYSDLDYVVKGIAP